MLVPWLALAFAVTDEVDCFESEAATASEFTEVTTLEAALLDERCGFIVVDPDVTHALSGSVDAVARSLSTLLHVKVDGFDADDETRAQVLGSITFRQADQVVRLTGIDLGNSAGETTSPLVVSDADVVVEYGSIDATASPTNALSGGTGHITLEQVTLQGGAAVFGGAVTTTSGSITATSSTFTDNIATQDGGALFTDSGDITLQDCTLSSNTASRGGAVWSNSGTVEATTNTTFVSNTAELSGGAVATDSGTVLATGGTTFDTNSAATGDGGAVFSASGPITLDDSILRFNTAANGFGGAAYAGSGPMQGNRTLLHDNEAQAGGAIATSSQLAEGEVEVEFADSQFHANVALGPIGGGAVYWQEGSILLDHTTFCGNSATGPGGEGGAVMGISVDEASVTYSTFANNESALGASALHVEGIGTFQDSVFVHNTGPGVTGPIFRTIPNDSRNAYGNNVPEHATGSSDLLGVGADWFLEPPDVCRLSVPMYPAEVSELFTGGYGFAPLGAADWPDDWDQDVDGYIRADVLGFLTTDCDDEDEAIHPGATEVGGNQLDENCNGYLQCYVRDTDGDGYYSLGDDTELTCPAKPSLGPDCDDDDAAVYPDAVDVPGNEVDENCNGTFACYDGPDGDGDGFASGGSDDKPFCDVGTDTPNGDCDDNDNTVNPGALEGIANGIDEDCNDVELCYVDQDQDGDGTVTGDLVASEDLTCSEPGVAATDTDCDDDDDTRAGTLPEVPGDGIDNDCDPSTPDEADTDTDTDTDSDTDTDTDTDSDTDADADVEDAAAAPPGHRLCACQQGPSSGLLRAFTRR